MRTNVCEMLAADVPVFAFSHCRDVVVEVSKAGGFGVLGCGDFTAEELRAELDWIDRHIGGRPYGVDLLMPSTYADVAHAAPAGDLVPAQQRDWVEHLLSHHGVPPQAAAATEQFQRDLLTRFTITARHHAALIDVAFDHPIRLLVAALGVPPPDVLARAHERGVKVGAMVGTVDHALAQRAAGVDLIIAQGTEAGGHTGQISTMVLVPQVVDAVAPLPVLAAGGIANGRQMAAALALGAAGVWCGSVWLATAQSNLRPQAKEKILAAKSSDAVITRSMTGKPCRALRSDWTQAWAAPGAPSTLAMPLQHLLTQEVMARADRARRSELISCPAGQVVGQIGQEGSVRQVVSDMLNEFADTLERLSGLVREEAAAAAES
jgi:NAD(P)H-dependent flavin oxidoreductase YrpB (nitropropane dioxygenase family)